MEPRSILHRIPAFLLLSMAWSACPSDWYAFNESCYFAFEGPSSWDDAKASCEEKSAQLASIHSQAENDHAIFACGNMRPFAQGCWIGGTDRNQRHRKWIWTDGSEWNWQKWFDHGGGNSEPNNDFCSNHKQCVYGSTSDCATLEVSGKVPFKGHWLDTFCTDKQKYICKMPDMGVVRSQTSVSNADVPLSPPPMPSIQSGAVDGALGAAPAETQTLETDRIEKLGSSPQHASEATAESDVEQSSSAESLRYTEPAPRTAQLSEAPASAPLPASTPLPAPPPLPSLQESPSTQASPAPPLPPGALSSSPPQDKAEGIDDLRDRLIAEAAAGNQDDLYQ